MTYALSQSQARLMAPRLFCSLAMATAAVFGMLHALPAHAQDMPQYFATPDKAAQALVDAVRQRDDMAVASILGPDGASSLSSGDADEDASAQKAFVRKYDAMHRWATLADGSMVLYVGADNYAYPFPLKKDATGWRFDGMAGTDEIRARRIGSHELLAMDAVNAMALAEEAYKAREHQYASRIISKPGSHDGLFWTTAKGEPLSPLGDLRDLTACATCVDGSQEFDGYVFRIVDAKQAGSGVTSYVVDGKLTGGFAVLATPATYGDTGIMSFLIDRDGVLYEKDLGASTSEVATTLKAYDVRDGWKPADQ